MKFERRGDRMWVRVEQAATKATVTVNGQKVGEHLGAWTPFELEITGFLQEENELEVHCEEADHTTNGFLPAVGIRWTGARHVEIRREKFSGFFVCREPRHCFPGPRLAGRRRLGRTGLLYDRSKSTNFLADFYYANL